MANYASVTWTGGDTITEAKLDNMVANDRAEDAHESGVNLLNNTPIKAKDVGGTLRDLIKLNSVDELVLGGTGVDRMIFSSTRQEEQHDNGNSGASPTINWFNGSNQKITLSANAAFTFSNVAAGDILVLQVVQDGTGSRTITWPSTTKAVDGVVDLSAGANDITWYTIYAVSATEFHILGQTTNLDTV